MKYQVIGTAHVAFVMTVDSADEDKARETAAGIVIDAIEFGKPDRCSVDVDVSTHKVTPSPAA